MNLRESAHLNQLLDQTLTLETRRIQMQNDQRKSRDSRAGSSSDAELESLAEDSAQPSASAGAASNLTFKQAGKLAKAKSTKSALAAAEMRGMKNVQSTMQQV